MSDQAWDEHRHEHDQNAHARYDADQATYRELVGHCDACAHDFVNQLDREGFFGTTGEPAGTFVECPTCDVCGAPHPIHKLTVVSIPTGERERFDGRFTLRVCPSCKT